ncbi:exonuclease domain-containing protein [Amycolatopsis aidingensis]|uniref:exonuclease domain-containing protein n=1 Tax=Amycolatopsis aidingensis TaxID=2842453 RepID=UPI001C0C8265|nr:exonuclease domain-containing protein [Amycolatopsis aidingensis]
MTAPAGYAVVDTETTGLFSGYRHRIAEIAIIQLDLAGTVTGEWSTLVNPDRDLGPQAVHGIRAADVRRAPRFEQIAGDVAERLRNRVVVAHNWPFDAMHLRSEFERMGIEVPLHPDAGLCTMRAAGVALPGSRRSLIDCCAAAGLPEMSWHTARDDAMAAAFLFQHMMLREPTAVEVTPDQLRTAAWQWPLLDHRQVTPVRRMPAGQVEPHFLARLVERIPRDTQPAVDGYFAMLDGALLDRQISATEADSLLDIAQELGLHKADVLAAHRTYLRALARAGWEDGVITEDERRDLDAVAALLGLDHDSVDAVLEQERNAPAAPGIDRITATVSVGGLVLRPGDKIVLTGTMRRDREEIREQITAAGLRVTTAVSKRTRVLVAADPDSLSGKAKDARQHGIPVVGEETFLRLLDMRLDKGAVSDAY